MSPLLVIAVAAWAFIAGWWFGCVMCDGDRE